MAARAMILVMYFLLAIGIGMLSGKEHDRGLANDAPLLSVVINDLKSERRIAISVINVRATNIQLIKAVNHAVNMGDATVTFERNGVKYRREASASNLIADVVGWFPGGQGFTQARKKEFYVATLGLEAGCYNMRVTYSNEAARKAPGNIHPGPVTQPAIALSEVCFDDRDVAGGLELRRAGNDRPVLQDR